MIKFACMAVILMAACKAPINESKRSSQIQSQDQNQNPQYGDKAEGYRLTLYPIFARHCRACHVKGGPASQAPFADLDINVAVGAVLNPAGALVNLTKPDSSKVLAKLETGHNCWGDCGQNQKEILAAIQKWSLRSGDNGEPETVQFKSATVSYDLAAAPGVVSFLFPNFNLSVDFTARKISENGMALSRPTIKSSSAVFTKGLVIFVDGSSQLNTFTGFSTLVRPPQTLVSSSASTVSFDKTKGTLSLMVGFRDIKPQ